MQPTTYKAAIYRDIRNVDVVELGYPSCGDDDIVIRNLMCGVCGTDIAAYHHGPDGGRWKDLEFGHEAISEVVEVGRNVLGVNIGDHVFPNYGKALRDLTRMATVGGFSEYIHIPNCEVGYSILKLDKNIPLHIAVLAEPFVIGLRCATTLKPTRGEQAIVFGAGIIGIAAAIMLRWLGCSRVMVVDTSELRLDIAGQLGFLTCNPAQEDLNACAREVFGLRHTHFGDRCGADLYVDAIGHPVALDYFTALACQQATLSVVGIHHTPVALDLMEVCYNNWHITGCGDLSIEEAMPTVESVLKSDTWDLSILVTHQYPVEQIAEALTMGARWQEALKVCVNFFH